MFQQNPHPIYKALLNNNYSLNLFENQRMFPGWFELNCLDQKILVKSKNGTLYTLDLITDEKSSFTWEYIFSYKSEGEVDDITKVLNEYVPIVRKSIDPKNEKLVELLMHEITQNYPGIKKLYFEYSSHKKEKSFTISDENDYFYEVLGENTLDSIYDFYFIEGLDVFYSYTIKEFSNHQLIKNIEKIFQIKDELKIDLKINLRK